MPVGAYNGPNVSTANGVATSFPYDFRILSASHLRVALNGVDQVTGFNVDGINNPTGGNVNFSVAPANGIIVTRELAVPYTRTTDYQRQGAFDEETVDKDFDERTMQIQQLDDRLLRTPVLAPEYAGLGPLLLPAPVAGALLGWNFDATLLQYYLPTAIPAFGDVTIATLTANVKVLTPLVDAGAAALDLRGLSGSGTAQLLSVVGGSILGGSGGVGYKVGAVSGDHNGYFAINAIGVSSYAALAFTDDDVVGGWIVGSPAGGEIYYVFNRHHFINAAFAEQLEVLNTASATSHPTITGAAAAGTVGGAIGTSDGRSLALSCGRLQFPAVQASSSDANTLDDYEEGAWTPAVGGTATYTLQAGVYVKIGRVVTFYGRMTINVIGTGSTTSISGLPFNSDGGNTQGVNVRVVAGSATNIVSSAGVVTTVSASVGIVSRVAASAADAANAIFANGTEVIVYGTYISGT